MIKAVLIPPENDEAQDWIFTFGTDGPFGKRYFVINGTYRSAREKMFRIYGRKWAFMYESVESAGVVKFGYTEISQEELLEVKRNGGCSMAMPIYGDVFVDPRAGEEHAKEVNVPNLIELRRRESIENPPMPDMQIMREGQVIFTGYLDGGVPRVGESLCLAKWDTHYTVVGVTHFFGKNEDAHFVHVNVEITGK